ncbi:MAG: peptidylprolyl isomerase [Bacteroidetes bacterium]|nr:peptidylprolyl isomerase [Bacteroidota bacterium]
MNRLALFVFAVLSLVSVSCSAQLKKVEDNPPYSGPTLDKYCSNPKRLLVFETVLGTMKIQLFDKVAPNHVAQITKLAKDHMYDGTYFHRIIPGFMIQGGDPNTKDADPSNDGMGGMGDRLKAEFNEVKHLRGVCSMARTQDPNSATSQFFVCNATASMLDHQYTVWGQLVQGYDVLDKITALHDSGKYQQNPADGSVNPGKDALITKAWVQE